MHRIPKDLIPRAASFFKVVGDETRMKILCAIATEELCVNEIAETVSMTKSAVSHQLKLLKDEGLVKSRREGKNIFYSLDDQHVVDILDIAFIHIEHKGHGSGCDCDHGNGNSCGCEHCSDGDSDCGIDHDNSKDCDCGSKDCDCGSDHDSSKDCDCGSDHDSSKDCDCGSNHD